MTATVGWLDILLRVGAAVLAGAVVGYDRGTRGRIAGLRTTILMCLAATGAMIEANLTLSVIGRTPQSFTTMDALRFPLGVLSGIGFIGAGAIVRRGTLVTGVTTAATMWLMTVVGLMLGGGYFFLGAITTAVAVVVLAVLKKLEARLNREHRANLTVETTPEGLSAAELRRRIAEAGFHLTSFAAEYGAHRTMRCVVTWYSPSEPHEPPPLTEQLSQSAGAVRVDWQPIEAGHLSD